MACERARRAAEVGKTRHLQGELVLHRSGALPQGLLLLRKWETLQDKAGSPGAFSPFPKAVVSATPQTGHGTNRSGFGMGPREGGRGLGWAAGDAWGHVWGETAGGGFLQLVGDPAGIWSVPNHLQPLQSCLGLTEFPCTCCHPHAWWEAQHQRAASLGGQSQNPLGPGGREAAAAPEAVLAT